MVNEQRGLVDDHAIIFSGLAHRYPAVADILLHNLGVALQGVAITTTSRRFDAQAFALIQRQDALGRNFLNAAIPAFNPCLPCRSGLSTIQSPG